MHAAKPILQSVNEDASFRSAIFRLSLSGLRLLFLLLTTLGAAAQPKRVLIVHSFVNAAPPFTTHSMAFETTLTTEMGEPVDLDEITLDVARYATSDMEEALVEYLRKRQEKWQPDLVVPVGSPAGVFVAQYRDRLFPMTPVIYTGMDRRRLPPDALQKNAAFIGESFDFPGMVEDILQVSPATTNIAVVLGASQLEQYWAAAIQREWLPFTNRVSFTWLNDLSFDQMLERVSTLPPRSFIFLVLLMRDASGVTHNTDEALNRIHAVANAPVTGIFQHQLGLGIVGGRLYQAELEGEESARVAIRILRGEGATNFPPKIIGPLGPRYNGQELQRWNISEDRLPPRSVILFRQPGFWVRYWRPIAGTFCFILFQTGLIAGLVINRARRRQGEREAILIADVSSKFVNLSPGEVDHEILDAQRRIFEMFDLDVSGFWQWSADASGFFRLTHYSRAGEDPQIPERMNSQEYFPWYQQQVLAGRTIAVRSMTELPPEAARDRETFRQFGFKSNLTIPLLVGGEPPVGALGFNTTRVEREWPDALVKRLQLVAQIFANALARKRADQALRESEERIRMSQQAARVGAFDWNIKTGVNVWTPELEAMHGLPPGGFAKTQPAWERLVHPDDRAAAVDRVELAFRTGEPVAGEWRVIWPDGSVHWLFGRFQVFKDKAGEPLRMTGVNMDITERKHSEQEITQQRNQLTHLSRVTMLGELSGSLAHELNQPLTAILSNAQAGQRFLAQDKVNLDELRHILKDIVDDDKRAGEVIRRLRLLLKKGEVRQQPLDVNAAVQEILKLVRSDLVIHGVTAQTELAPGLPMIHADPVQFQQVLLNLVMNACDAMRGHAASDRQLIVRTEWAESGSVCVSVSDRGCGIPADAIEQVFEPFFTTKAHGMGLGLSVCCSIIEAHRGRIWAENNASGGATFRVTLPVAAEATK